MNIKTKNGIAEPLPLSDIQRNNKILVVLTTIIAGFLIYIIWLTWYIISRNVLNNIVARCL